MTRTVWIVVTPCGTQAILSLLGTLSSSSCTIKPSAKPSTQPRQVASRQAGASRWARAGSVFPSLSMLEQTSRKSRPDRLISGCSGVLFGPVLAGVQTKPVLARKQIKKVASSAGTRSRRTAASNQCRDSTSDSGCCQQSETCRSKTDGQARSARAVFDFSTDFHNSFESHPSRKPFPSTNLNPTVSNRLHPCESLHSYS